MRGIVKERAAAASLTENGPVALRYKEVRSRLFFSEMPFRSHSSCRQQLFLPRY